ncbi:MAG: hypothetical protein J5672_03560 [Verrucomicrobia bacterium]|nr:hypothetical protein [Verrucomicrobiota bacterium]
MRILENRFIGSCRHILSSLLVFCFLICAVSYFAQEIQHIFVTPYIINSEVLSGFLDENKILLNGVIYSGLISALSCIAVIFLVKKNWIKILCCIILFASCVFLLSPIYSFMQNKSTDGLKKRASLIFAQNTLAFRKYIHETKHFPPTLEDAVSALSEIRSGRNNIAAEYLNCRLTEPYSGMTNITQEFDGTGGWVYDSEKGIFGINVKELEEYSTNFTEYLKKVKKDHDTQVAHK